MEERTIDGKLDCLVKRSDRPRAYVLLAGHSAENANTRCWGSTCVASGGTLKPDRVYWPIVSTLWDEY